MSDIWRPLRWRRDISRHMKLQCRPLYATIRCHKSLVPRFHYFEFCAIRTIEECTGPILCPPRSHPGGLANWASSTLSVSLVFPGSIMFCLPELSTCSIRHLQIGVVLAAGHAAAERTSSSMTSSRLIWHWRLFWRSAKTVRAVAAALKSGTHLLLNTVVA